MGTDITAMETFVDIFTYITAKCIDTIKTFIARRDWITFIDINTRICCMFIYACEPNSTRCINAFVNVFANKGPDSVVTCCTGLDEFYFRWLENILIEIVKVI